MLIFSLLEHSLKQHVQEGIYLPQKHTYNLHSLHYIMIPPSSPYWSQRLGNCPKFVFSVHSALNQSWISISSSFHIHPSHHHFPLLLSHVQPFATPWTTACQASLSFTISWSLLKLMSIELMMPSNHLILCHPLLLPSIFPSLRVFSSELALHIRWPKYWSLSISPSMHIQDWFPLGLTCLISLLSKGLSRVFSNITVQKHQFFGIQASLWFNSHIHTWLLEKPSIQFSHSVVSNSLRLHGLQHARLPYPPPTPGASSNSCPSRWWCHPTISSSVIPFSSRFQSFPESGSFPIALWEHHSFDYMDLCRQSNVSVFFFKYSI